MNALSPKEDLREWLVDNFTSVEYEVNKICIINLSKSEIDKVEIDTVSDEMCASLKTGLLNIIDTYKKDVTT